jgi:hypothetical protein
LKDGLKHEQLDVLPSQLPRMQLLSEERKNWVMEDHPMKIDLPS